MKLPSTNIEFREFCRKVIACSAIASLTITPAASFSIPMNGVISNGAANIASSGNTMTITQGTNKAVIDWQGFNVGEGEGVVFSQPNSASTTLNRIHDINPSVIDGEVTANGNIMLINRNGMVFGKNSKVDVGGMLATTADISDDDFIHGKQHFDKAGNANARIVNHGVITAKPGGGIALVAPNVENSGTINAKLGKVQLGGAETFTIDTNGDGLIQYDVTHSLTSQGINHSGNINAEGGLVSMTTAAADSMMDSMINVTGDVNVANKNGQGGSVIVQSGTHSANGRNGRAIISGSIDASGNKGGAIYALGDQVALEKGAKLNATGKKGGGAVLVGGDYKGGGNAQKARQTVMDKDAFIDVSALDTGDGGKAILWSDDSTKFFGTIKATGGAKGGNGGFVETSGHFLDTTGGIVSASAPHGNAGTWLLDPYDIIISPGAGVNTNINCIGSPQTCTPTNNSTIFADNISAALSGGTSVFITTGVAGGSVGNIQVDGQILMNTFVGAATLTLQAAGAIWFNGGSSITAVGGSILNVVLNSDSDANGDGPVQLRNSTTISTNGGNITIGGGALTGGVPTDSSKGSLASGIPSGIQLTTSTLDAGGGNIWMSGQADITTGWDGVDVQQGSVVRTTGNGNITMIGYGGGANGGSGVAVWDGVASTVSVQNGNMNLTGYGIGAAGNMNPGLYLESSITDSTGIGNINITGTGAPTSGGGSPGIWTEAASIRSFGTGSITLNGSSAAIAGAGGNNDGIRLNNNSLIRSSSGTINLTGTGGIGTGGGSTGMSIVNSTLLAVGAANIIINATAGGSGASVSNNGIYSNGSTVSSANGNVTITAQGGNTGGAGGDQWGLYANASTFSTSGGTVDITATGGNSTGNNNHGLVTDGTNFTATGNGNLMLRGNGSGTGNNEMGIFLDNTSNVTAVNGNINLIGTGSANSALGFSNGIYLNNTTTIGTSGTGNISLTGTGGGGATDTVGTNHGVYVYNGSVIQSTSAQTNRATQGTITINGTGGSLGGTGAVNLGTWFRTNSLVSSADGNISITGTGGNSSGIYNDGFALDSGANITATGGAGVTISGTGRGTGQYGYGLYFNSGSTLSAVNGDINLTGVGTATGLNNDNWGIIVDNGVVTSTGLGNILMTGTGGGAPASVGTGSYGVYMRNAGTIYALNGTTSITGYEGKGTAGTNQGFATDGTANAIGNNLASGALIMLQDSWLINTLAARTHGALTIANATSGSTIGVGTGAGKLSVTDLMFTKFSAGVASSVTVGSATAGAMDINSAFAFTKPLTFRTGGGATPDITVNGQITNSSFGDTIVASGRNLINNVGAAMFNMTGGGNWRTYSTNPASDFTNGLISNYHRYSCTYGGACPALGVGNGALYSYTPLLNVTPNALGTLNYGDPIPNLTPYAYTLTGYLVGDSVLDVIGGSVNGTTTYTTGAPGGSYSVSYSSGALTSSLGYGFNYLSNATAITAIGGGNGATGGFAGGGVVLPSIPPLNILPDPVAPPVVVLPPVMVTPSTPSTPSGPSTPPSMALVPDNSKELLERVDSSVEQNNTYFGVFPLLSKRYTPSTYFWDLYRFSPEAVRVFDLSTVDMQGAKANIAIP